MRNANVMALNILYKFNLPGKSVPDIFNRLHPCSRLPPGEGWGEGESPMQISPLTLTLENQFQTFSTDCILAVVSPADAVEREYFLKAVKGQRTSWRHLAFLIITLLAAIQPAA